MPSPQVSVLMPVYNGERFIAEAIESVLAQTLAAFELIVVDDGSTDRTAEIVRSYRDPRIVLLTREKIGLSAALNFGLAACRAPWVARLDSDDVMEPPRLERQLAFVRERPSIGGAASYFSWLDEAGRVRGADEPRLRTREEIGAHLRGGGRLIYAHPTVIYRRDIVLSLGGYDAAFEPSEDVDLFMRMYEAGRPLLVQPERLTRFRVHENSISARGARRQYIVTELIFLNHHRKLAGADPLTLDQQTRLWTRSPYARARLHARVVAYQLKRSYLVARMRRRRVRAAVILLGAALLHPKAAAQRAVRAVRALAAAPR